MHMYIYIYVCVEHKKCPKSNEICMEIFQQTSNVDKHNLHSRKGTPQFAVMDCALFLLWYSVPRRPRMIDTTFR